MKRNIKRSVLAATTLAIVLGIGFHVRELPAKAQASGVSSTPEAQSPEKNKQEEDENDAYRKSPAVVALGAKLGLNPDQSAMAFTVTNFVLLAVLVGWGLVKMLPKTLGDRNTAIQKHLVDARTATEEARARLATVEARLSKLDDEIAAMRSDAEQIPPEKNSESKRW